MNAVGIDVSKGKSTVTIRRPGDIVLMPPIYRKKEAVKGFLFSIHRGVCGLLGVNGVGKSTMINCAINGRNAERAD